MVPEREVSTTAGVVSVELPKLATNVIDAAATGASDGMKLAVNVAAMLLSFIALIAMFNGLLGWLGGFVGFENLTFELIMGYAFAPVAWILGCPWADCVIVGNLLAKKLVLNEFVAYLDLKSNIPNLSERSVIISTYALCGFSNFSSIAIQVGGIGTLAPQKRSTIVDLGVKSLIAGTVACLMTAAIAGLLI
jgi:CNT family concentrative nucleoside transporter